MSRALPTAPDVEHLEKQAKALLRAAHRGDPATLEQFRAVGAFSPANPPKLADAQHLLARDYGFANWSLLKQRVLVLAGDSDPLAAFAAAVLANDETAAAAILARYPNLARTLNDPIPGGAFDGLAIHAAVRFQNTAMVDLLLGAGADIDAKSRWWAGGFSALDVADPAFAPRLIERGAAVTIHAAARLGMLDVVAQRLREYPDAVRVRGGDGQTPLHVAANVAIARLLLDHGAELDALDVDHESTAAMYHVGERPDVTRFLMSRGCATDILMASAVGDIDLVRKYLERDPESVRVTVSDESFPRRNPSAGGTIYIWTLGGHKSPHAVARDFGHDDIVQLLMAHTPDSLQLTLAMELGEEERYQTLLARNPVLVAALTEDERLKLVRAAEMNNTSAVRAMLEAGWPVAIRRGSGATALHWAGFHGNAEMVRDLLRHGAPIDTVEAQFRGTPLQWTLHGSEHGWKKDTGDYAGAASALLDAGAVLPPTDRIEASEQVLALLRARRIDV